MKRSHNFVNNYNIWINLALKCNMDIKLFLMKALYSLAIVFYLTYYSTKSGLSSYNILEFAEIAIKIMDKHDNSNSSDEKSKKFIIKCYNAMVSHTEYSGAQVAAMILNIGGKDGTVYFSHETEPFYIYDFLNQLNQDYEDNDELIDLNNYGKENTYNTYDY